MRPSLLIYHPAAGQRWRRPAPEHVVRELARHGWSADLVMDADGTPTAGVYPGIKLGTLPGMAATLLPFAGAALFVLVARPNP